MAGQRPLFMKVFWTRLVSPASPTSQANPLFIFGTCPTAAHRWTFITQPRKDQFQSSGTTPKKVCIAKDHKICSVSVLNCSAEVRWTGPAMSPSPNAGWSVDSSIARLSTVHMECLHWVRGDGLFINRIRCLGGRHGETYRRVNRSDGFIEMHIVRRAEWTEPLNHSLGMIIMTDLWSQLTDVFQKASWFQSKPSCICPCDCTDLPAI